MKRINGVMSEASDWKREVSSHAFVHTGQCITFQALLQPGKPQMWVQKESQWKRTPRRCSAPWMTRRKRLIHNAPN